MTGLYIAAMPIISGMSVCASFFYLDQTRFAVRGVVGPFFTSLALMFGLFASLVASEEWQKVSRANLLIQNEVSALRSLIRIAEAVGADKEVRPLVSDYLHEVKTNEEAFFTSGRPDALTPRPLLSVRQLFKFAASDNWRGNEGMRSAFIAAVEKARSFWLERQELRKSHVARRKFAVIFFFGLLTQVAIALCHAGNQRAINATVMLFSLGFAAAMVMLVALDDPYGASHLINEAVLGDVA